MEYTTNYSHIDLEVLLDLVEESRLEKCFVASEKKIRWNKVATKYSGLGDIDHGDLAKLTCTLQAAWTNEK